MSIIERIEAIKKEIEILEHNLSGGFIDKDFYNFAMKGYQESLSKYKYELEESSK
jgi:hypothetical protein